MGILKRMSRFLENRKKTTEKSRSREALRQLNQMRQNAYSNLFPSEKDRDNYLISLLEKLKNSSPLTLKEADILCSNLYPQDQLNCFACEDTRFISLYLKHFDSVVNNISSLSIDEQKQIMDFMTHWRILIMTDCVSSDIVYMETRKETRHAIRCMKKNSAYNNLSNIEIQSKEQEIFLRSKYLYIKICRIVEELGSNEIVMNFAGEDIHIDIFTLVHTFFRHYSELTKQYNDHKSYFTPEIIAEKLPTILVKRILTPIEESGALNGTLPQSLFIKYYGQLYRLYFNQKYVNNGHVIINRVNTFYPVNQAKDLSDTKIYIFKKINPNLYVGVLS